MKATRQAVPSSSNRTSRTASPATQGPACVVSPVRGGHHAIPAVLRNHVLQPKLTVSHPNDLYEQEADRVADQVLRMPDPALTRPGIDRTLIRPVSIQRLCQGCEEEEELQRQPQGSARDSEHSGLDTVTATLRQTGRPLDRPTRTFFEPRFGVDFSAVRIHTNTQASESARAVNALAYTVGHDVVFNSGQYAPHSGAGRRLLAHELTHVLQQGHAVRPPTRLQAVPFHTEAGMGEPDTSFAFCDTPEIYAKSRGGVSKAIIQRESEPVNKGPAQRELLDWHRMAILFVDRNRAWLAANWIAYLSRTSQNPRLGWTEGTAGSVLSNAIGNLLTELGTKLIKKLAKHSASAVGALIGTAIEPGLGTAIGFVIGVLVESAASMIFEAVTGKTEADEAANIASRRTGDLILASTGTLETQGAEALGSLEAVYGEIQSNLTNTTDQGTADRVLDWAIAEKRVTTTPAPLADRSLYSRMLADWVLEHAGDEEDAAKDTAEAQWEAARNEAFGAGDLDRHPEIFAYQTRGEWSKAGLPTDQAEGIISRVKDLRRDASDPAATVVGSFDRRSYSFDSATDPEKLIAYINDSHTIDSLSAGGKTAIRNNRFKLTCTLDLTTADGSCYVDKWEYKIRATNPSDIEWHASNEGGFNVSPD